MVIPADNVDKGEASEQDEYKLNKRVVGRNKTGSISSNRLKQS